LPPGPGDFAGFLAGRPGLFLLLLLAGSVLATGALAAPGRLSVLATLAKWTPLIAYGFVINIAISIAAMLLGTIAGVFVGIGRGSKFRIVRRACWLLTQFFRNAPWLILLFYCMMLIPYELRFGSTTVPFPGWLKAILGLALGVM